VARPGDKVASGDVVKLDGRLVKWQALNPSSSSRKQEFLYIKYWKPRGVICTTDRAISGNVIDQVCVIATAEQSVLLMSNMKAAPTPAASHHAVVTGGAGCDILMSPVATVPPRQ
jgi:hypothetical protein